MFVRYQRKAVIMDDPELVDFGGAIGVDVSADPPYVQTANGRGVRIERERLNRYYEPVPTEADAVKAIADAAAVLTEPKAEPEVKGGARTKAS